MTDRLNAALAGRYRIERELGQGGMATVYLAHDIRHERRVALKVLRPELSAVIGAARFLQEIKTTANLQHPHILPLHDSGEVDGTVFYVMPYVDGESLRDRLNREKQLPVDEAIRIAVEVAGALDYAHQNQVIHRDIKPENVLLQGGHALVADFGIALAAVRTGGGSRMTETGMSLGTPHYMSPEQAMGEREITARSDVYALGCVLYEMLSGEPPFNGPTAQAIVARVMTEEPRPLTAERRTVPRHVEAAVTRALAKLPADRFSSAAAFAEALMNPAAMQPEDRASAPARRRRRSVQLAAGLLALLVIPTAFLAGRGNAARATGPLVRFSIDLPDTSMTVVGCCGAAQAISPDGRTVVFVGGGDANTQLYRRGLGETDARPIPGTEGASTPFFSPDGRWVGFGSGGRLRKVSLSGGPPLPIAAAERIGGASWGDRDVIVYARQRRLFSVPAGGGEPQALTDPDSGMTHFHPSFLPGGDALLFSVSPTGGGEESLEAVWVALLDLQSGRIDTLTRGTKAAYANGLLLYTAADNTLLARPFDLKRRRLTGEAVPVAENVVLHWARTHEFAVSRGGALVYQHESRVSYSNDMLRVATSAGRTPVILPLTAHTYPDEPIFSPDGRRIALRIRGARSTQDLWLFDREQQTLERLTVGGGRFPSWSRDGRQIAFTRDDGIYVIAADGTGSPRRVLAGQQLMPGAWSADGRALLFQTGGESGQRRNIGMITIGDTVPGWLLTSEFSERHPQLSPDDRWLAYSSDRTGRSEVYVQPFGREGPRVQVSTSGGSSPRWSPDGRILYYVVDASIVAAVRASRADFRIDRRNTVVDGGVTDVHPMNVNWDIHPNGREFLYIDQAAGTGARLIWVLNWPEIVRAAAASKD